MIVLWDFVVKYWVEFIFGIVAAGLIAGYKRLAGRVQHDKETEKVDKTDTKDAVTDGKEESSNQETVASASTSTVQIDETEVATSDSPDDKNRRALIIAAAAIIIAALGAIAGMAKLGLLNAIAKIFKK